MAFPKFQTKEVLNKVLNTGEDALNVDLADSVSVTVDSEFPDAATIADNFANPDTTSVMSMLMGYDGSAWDRVTVGGGAEATALRVTIASDSTGVVTVDDGGGALTVDGTVTANLSATDNAVLDAMVVDLAAMETLLTAANVDHAANEVLLGTIDADTNAIKGHVDGIETLITSTNSKIDTFDAVLDNILTKNTEIDAVLDTIKVDTEAIETAVELLDNAIDGTEMQVDVVAALPSGTNTIGKVEVVGDVAENENAAGNPVLAGGRYDSPGNTNSSLRTLGDTDVGALALDPTGALYVREYLGQTGSCFVSGTAAVTAAIGKFVAIQFLEDTVFNGTDGLVATDSGRWPDDTDAATDISSSNTAAVGSQVFPQGMTIFGRWDSFILASGAVIAYVGNV